MILAQLSDLHLCADGTLCDGRVDPAAALAQAVSRLKALQPAPDVVLLTGDLANAGLPAEYALLRAGLAGLTLPVYLIPGNHDDRRSLLDAFPDHPWLHTLSGRIEYVIDDYPVRLVALDSVVPGEDGGLLPHDTLVWLDALLSAAPERPTVILMHHPPFPTGIAFMDRAGLANPGPLADVLRGHPHVERVLCGHLHRAIQTRFAGTLASTCPSTVHQIALQLGPDDAGAYTLEPPGMQLHRWSAPWGMVTHTMSLGNFQGPYVFGKH